VARFILINTSHAGNVGATARAMKTMGFSDLVLVAPRDCRVLTREETVQRASGANDVLEHSRIVATLDEALGGVDHLCATAMIARDFGPPTRSPRDHFESLINHLLSKDEQSNEAGCAQTADFDQKTKDIAHLHPHLQPHLHPPRMAFLFGSERFGMRNEDVYRCHVALSIPTNPTFGSLNIASAVQLIAYEWRLALARMGQGFEASDPRAAPQLADAQAVAGTLEHWERALTHIGFLNPEAPKKLMPRLQALFNRAELREEEVHILRGVAKSMLASTAAKKSDH
jgi:tRNA/rRNA methyltransferase